MNVSMIAPQLHHRVWVSYVLCMSVTTIIQMQFVDFG